MEYEELKKQLQENIHERLDMDRELSDEEIRDVIDKAILDKSREDYINANAKMALHQELFNAIRRLDLLQELVDDPEITEIMVNGTDSIFYEKKGRIYKWDRRFESKEELENVIRQIASGVNRQVNESVPIVDARLADGSRVNVVLDPVAINGPILTIRKFSQKPITMEDLIGWGSISREAADVLSVLVRAGYNIFISGGTGTGKTTFLNALADFIPKSDRIITIEDSAELQLLDTSDLVRLEVRQADSDHNGSVTMRDLIRTSLRMRPDRIIVGEVRGPEALDMVSAMNTGHAGSMSTGHAGSPEDMLGRLETMILGAEDIPLTAIRKQIASSLDVIVQLERMRDRSRRVTEITEITGCDELAYRLNPLFVFREDDRILKDDSAPYGENGRQDVCGSLVRTGNRLKCRKKLESAALSLDAV